MIYKIFVFFMMLTSISCFFPSTNQNICRDRRGPVRPCSPQEQGFIDVMRGIISQIRNFDISELSTSFAQNNKTLDESRLVFFGEKHTEIISQIETLGAMNALARDGDYLLLEGSDRLQKYVKDCALILIFGLYVNWQWESKGQRYTIKAIKNKETWRRRKNFEAFLKNTLDSYDISDLNLTKLTCGFWDDKKALADTYANDVTANNFERRNVSMVTAIDNALKKAKRVFVITGFLHMPSGDFHHNLSLNSNNAHFPKDLAKYYEILRRNPKVRSRFVLEVTAGTTEPIYNYLINNDIAYSELMHGKLIYP